MQYVQRHIPPPSGWPARPSASIAAQFGILTHRIGMTTHAGTGRGAAALRRRAAACLVTARRVVVNHKRTERIYREEGLSLRLRAAKKRPWSLRSWLPTPCGSDKQWGMDFVSDSLGSGRRIRIRPSLTSGTGQRRPWKWTYRLPVNGWRRCGTPSPARAHAAQASDGQRPGVHRSGIERMGAKTWSVPGVQPPREADG